MGRLNLSAFLTTVERSCRWVDRKARKVDSNPAALACWKHWKSARMSPATGVFRATRCSCKEEGSVVNGAATASCFGQEPPSGCMVCHRLLGHL